MPTARARIAFYAPMKPPDHPVPSGDREIARLTLEALRLAGFTPALACRLTLREGAGDPAAQERLRAQARAEAARLIATLAPDPPALWFTYHSYWKAPDLIGPQVAAALRIPYAIFEPSISPARRAGAWAGFAAAAEASIAAADRLFWTTARDAPALLAAGHAARMVHLPAFVDPGAASPPRPAQTPLRLLTAAMMRPGDKLESYRRLAAALACLSGDWHLTVIGSGEAEAEVRRLLTPFAARTVHLPAVAGPEALRPHYAAADLLLWPGTGEGVGMVWLEAQAAGLPVIAEDGPAARAIVGAGRLTPPADAPAMAAAIRQAAGERAALSALARAHVAAHHSLDAAARTLGAALRSLLP